MRKLLAFMILLFYSVSWGQIPVQQKMNIIGEPVKSETEFISTRDINGRFCAGLKIISGADGFKYDAYNGIVSYDDRPGIDIIAVLPDERVIEIYKTGYEPLKIILSEYGISLQEREVWELRLNLEKVLDSYRIQIATQPEDAQVYLDDSLLVDQSRVTAEVGSHFLRISRNGYTTIEDTINVSKSNILFEFNLIPKLERAGGGDFTFDLALMPFQNAMRNGDIESISLAVHDILYSGLRQYQTLSVMQREELVRLLQKQELSPQQDIDTRTAIDIGRATASKYALAGTYMKIGNTLRFAIDLLDIAAGRIIYQQHLDGSEETIFAIQDEILQTIRKLYDIDDTVLLAVSGTSKFDAVVEYGRAVGELDRGNKKAAIERLQSALALDENFSLAERKLSRISQTINWNFQNAYQIFSIPWNPAVIQNVPYNTFMVFYNNFGYDYLETRRYFDELGTITGKKEWDSRHRANSILGFGMFNLKKFKIALTYAFTNTLYEILEETCYDGDNAVTEITALPTRDKGTVNLIGLSCAYPISDQLFAGVNLKYVRDTNDDFDKPEVDGELEQTGGFRSTDFTADIGLYYKLGQKAAISTWIDGLFSKSKVKSTFGYTEGETLWRAYEPLYGLVEYNYKNDKLLNFVCGCKFDIVGRRSEALTEDLYENNTQELHWYFVNDVKIIDRLFFRFGYRNIDYESKRKYNPDYYFEDRQYTYNSYFHIFIFGPKYTYKRWTFDMNFTWEKLTRQSVNYVDTILDRDQKYTTTFFDYNIGLYYSLF